MVLNINLPDFNLPPRIMMGLAVFLAFLTGITLILGMGQWHDDWVLAYETQISAPIVNTDKEAQMIASIPDQHLFGETFSKGDVPITNLQLQVTGIVKINGRGGNSASKAYISEAGQPSKIYQVGDSLPDGVKIYDITEDAVILENNGRLEKLPLPRQTLEFKPRNQGLF